MNVFGLNVFAVDIDSLSVKKTLKKIEMSGDSSAYKGSFARTH